MVFILFHGAFGSSTGNWFPVLKNQLESLGQKVIVPQFPVDNSKNLIEGKVEPTEQTLEKWTAYFVPIFKSIPKDEKICFVGHSLGCIFALRMVEKFKIQLDSAIFVGAFLDCLPDEIWPYTKIIPNFQKTDFDPLEMKQLIPVSYILFSDNDPYVPNRQSIVFSNMIGGSVISLKNAGHMNQEVSLDEFSLVLDLCLTRLDLSYAQKFNLQKQKIIAFENIQSQSIKGQTVFETKSSITSQLYNFQNINNSGYATLYTKIKELQMAHSSYMEFSRIAVKRMKIFERIIILDSIDDIKDTDTLEQIRADIDSGIKIFVCLYDKIKNLVPEPDFGIWDNRYICINQFNRKTYKPTNTIVSNNSIELIKVRKWWKIVKKHSVPILHLPISSNIF